MMKEKKVYFEVMRILAIFLVIYNHLEGYKLYMISEGTKQYVYMYISMFTRVNVPLFFMISGALLLGKEEDYNVILKKRILRFFLTIIIFGLGINILDFFVSSNNGKNVNFEFIPNVLRIFKGYTTNSYWFLYSYLGMLFCLPFLQRIAKSLKGKDIIVLLFLHFIIYSLLPILNILDKKNSYSLSNDFVVPFVSIKALFYSLIGYYIDHKVDRKYITKRNIILLSLISFVGATISVICTTYMGKMKGKYSQDYVQLFDYIITISTFIFIKYKTINIQIKSNTKKKIEKIICCIGSLTFGIYLLDPYLKLLLYDYYEKLAEAVLPTFIVSVGWCFISMIIGGGITYFLKKMPFFKKIL